ncbi:Collar domain-containing protein [Tenacibaculum sp. 190524A02b]|uniref:phage tail protein n=1 Tax=Tenacibaculum vairaonense TaxID=3137860 RepID=UPI0032B24059
MNSSLYNITTPVGTVIAFAGNIDSYKNIQNTTTPFVTSPIEAYGWMLCDGTALKAANYPELYAAIGKLYGSSGSGNDLCFNLPDLRGQFLRGIGTDTASIENRIAPPGGTKTGVGSIQKDALQTHQHTYTKPTGAPAPGESSEGTSTVNTNAYTGVPTSENDPSSVRVSQYETRPVNTFINYLIKYTYSLSGLNDMHDFNNLVNL